MGLGIRGWRRVGLGLCKVGGVGSRSNSAPWILCSAVRTISKNADKQLLLAIDYQNGGKILWKSVGTRKSLVI